MLRNEEVDNNEDVIESAIRLYENNQYKDGVSHLLFFSTSSDPNQNAYRAFYLAKGFMALSEIKQAKSYFKKALSWAKLQNNNSLLSQIHYNLGQCYQELRKYSEAITHYRDALVLFTRKDASVEDDVDRAYVYSYIAECYSSQGIYDEALEYYQQALMSFESLKMPNDMANALLQIGILYNLANKYQRSEPFLKRASSLFEKLEEKESVADALQQLGLCHIKQQHFSMGSDALFEALIIYEEIGKVEATAVTNFLLAVCYANKHEHTVAHGYLKEAIGYFNSDSISEEEIHRTCDVFKFVLDKVLLDKFKVVCFDSYRALCMIVNRLNAMDKMTEKKELSNSLRLGVH